MQHARRRDILDAVARFAEPARQIDILEIRPERLGKAAKFQDNVAAIEGAGTAGRRHRAGIEEYLTERLPPTPRPSEPAAVVLIAGTVDDRMRSGARPAEHERCD